MHFSKTYAQLLLTLPPDLREAAVEYRQLKKLINQVVRELTSLGLSPDVLHEFVRPTRQDGKLLSDGEGQWSQSVLDPPAHPQVIYELNTVADHIEPRLHVWGIPPIDSDESDTSLATSEDNVHVQSSPDVSDSSLHFEGSDLQIKETTSDPQERIITLKSDTQFYDSLLLTLQSLHTHIISSCGDFEEGLRNLSRDIATLARPTSSTSSFHAYSGATSDPPHISAQTSYSHFLSAQKSDLYRWREIFQLYVEMEIFESQREASRGETTIEESEQRLATFVDRLRDKGLLNGRKFHLKASRDVLATFLQMITFLLSMKKFQFITTEAVRKILKKHTKRTALPLSPDFPSPLALASGVFVNSSLPLPSHAVAPRSGSLSLWLGQAVGEIVLPIIPHIDDYECVICTSIAFKPVRLHCGHMFCVRCLVKMQKRGEGNCPICRAATVLSANRTNVDWALMNFMRDWFPEETKEKLKQNEKEVVEEEMRELRELGFNPNACIIA